MIDKKYFCNGKEITKEQADIISKHNESWLRNVLSGKSFNDLANIKFVFEMEN